MAAKGSGAAVRVGARALARRAAVPRKGVAAALPAVGVDKTRNDIVAAALKLFAKRGIGAVSLREIVQKSGQGNQSAIHYHFGNKRGLVAAVAAQVHGKFQPHLDATLAELEADEAAGRLGDEDLIAALVMPVILVYHADDDGRDAIYFIARLASDGGDAGQALLLREARAYVLQIERRLAPRLSGKPREKIWLHMLLSLSTTVFGLTALGGLRHSPFGKQEPLYSGKREQSIRDFMDFVCHGALGN